MAGVSSSSAIDLSRLPAPSVVETLSFEAILAENVASLQDLLPEFDATVESDPAVKLLQVFSYRELLIRQQFNDRVRQVMLAYSVGSNLDQLGALVNVARLVVDEGDPDAGIAPTYESDDDFRARIQMAPEAFSVAGPASAYEFHARSADANITDARASSPEPGVVQVALLSRFGTGAASDAQIEAVEVALGDPVRPLTDNVLVVSAAIIPYQIEAELTLFEGPDEAVVLTAAQAKVEAFKESERRIGRNITRAGLFAALKVEGVSNINLLQPPADVEIADDQCANNVGTNITVVGRGQ